jgi:hypothetical protein
MAGLSWSGPVGESGPVNGPPRIWPSVRALFEPMTSARMTLLWRLYGVMLALLWLQQVDHDSVFEFVGRAAGSHVALACGGLALIATGSSPVALVATALAGVWLLRQLLAGDVPTLEFVADEYLVQAGVPILAAIVTAVYVATLRRRGHAYRGDRTRDDLDELHARVFRIVLVTTLGFAGLHKLNADFFGPRSCIELAGLLGEHWPLPWSPPQPSPAAIVGLELLAAAMLLVYPRVGILLVLVVVAGLGHIGPAAFAATCTVLSLAFLDRGDLVHVQRAVARHWGSVLAVVTAVLIGSASVYRGSPNWLRYAMLEVLLIVAAGLTLAAAAPRIRALVRRPRLARLRPALLRWQRRAPSQPLPGLTSWLVLLLVVNGMTPYLGVKYRLSVAMLSNLRVDEERWNSYVVPEAVRLREHTPHTVVHWQPSGPWNPRPSKPGGVVLRDGLYAGAALREALDHAFSRRARGRLTLRWQGQTTEFELPADILSAKAWADARPSSPLWQAQLGPGDQPQACVH